MRSAPRAERGAAVVDFVLIMVLLIPLVLGIMHVGLVLHVRNTMSAAASEGARRAATVDGGPADGVAVAQQLIASAISDRFATQVSAQSTVVEGLPGTVVRATAKVPALGMFGPSTEIDVAGHAVEEALP